MLRYFCFGFFWSGWSSQISSIVSPHELLKKLQLVQHEQRETPNDPPRPCPGLAPRFSGPTRGLIERPGPTLSTTALSENTEMQFPVSTADTVNIPVWFSSVPIREGAKES